MEGADRIKLARTDRDANGEHHYIPLSWVDTVEDGKIKLHKTAAEVDVYKRQPLRLFLPYAYFPFPGVLGRRRPDLPRH